MDEPKRRARLCWHGCREDGTLARPQTDINSVIDAEIDNSRPTFHEQIQIRHHRGNPAVRVVDGPSHFDPGFGAWELHLDDAFHTAVATQAFHALKAESADQRAALGDGGFDGHVPVAGSS